MTRFLVITTAMWVVAGAIMLGFSAHAHANLHVWPWVCHWAGPVFLCWFAVALFGVFSLAYQADHEW